MARGDYDRFRNALEALVERTVDALEKGRTEVLKEARVGKVKLLDIYQLRRERGRLYQRLGEEVYGLVRKNALEIPSLSRTLAKIAALDEKIAAKEAEIDRLRGDEELLLGELEELEDEPRLRTVDRDEAGEEKKADSKADTKPKKGKSGTSKSKSKKGKKKRKKRTLGGDGNGESEKDDKKSAKK